jgi:hypothetical protein
VSNLTKSFHRPQLNEVLKKRTVPFRRVIFPQQIGIAKRDCPLFQQQPQLMVNSRFPANPLQAVFLYDRFPTCRYRGIAPSLEDGALEDGATCLSLRRHPPASILYPRPAQSCQTRSATPGLTSGARLPSPLPPINNPALRTCATFQNSAISPRATRARRFPNPVRHLRRCNRGVCRLPIYHVPSHENQLNLLRTSEMHRIPAQNRVLRKTDISAQQRHGKTHERRFARIV